MKLNVIDIVAAVLVIIGGVNWGLVGALKFNLVDTLFGVDSVLSRVVYIVVGLAALYMIYTLVKMMGTTNTASTQVR